MSLEEEGTAEGGTQGQCQGDLVRGGVEPQLRLGCLGGQTLRGPLPQVFGLGSVAHMVLGGKMGSYLGVNLGFGFGVTMGVYMAGNISGE